MPTVCRPQSECRCRKQEIQENPTDPACQIATTMKGAFLFILELDDEV